MVARPLSAQLSQLLVAYTLEFDSEFERQMAAAGYPGALLSLTIWANLVRFLTPDAMTVSELARKAPAAEEGIKALLACLERWRFLTLPPTSPRRAGWGSSRGIRGDTQVQLTKAGLAASRIWRPLPSLIDQRWEKRFGHEAIASLRAALSEVAGQSQVELPALLDQALQAFRIEFEKESATPLELCANILRVLGEQPLREAEIPRLTGASPETSGLGWQVKPYVIVESDPKVKGKLVRLSPRGLKAQQAYYLLTAKIEERWPPQLRDALRRIFDQDDENGPLLRQGLIPAPGTVRSGDLQPALGRKDVGAAARKRARDMVAQTQAFLQDPLGTLPHYPLWDINRGFGP